MPGLLSPHQEITLRDGELEDALGRARDHGGPAIRHCRRPARFPRA
jgi:hypothetical protein